MELEKCDKGVNWTREGGRNAVKFMLNMVWKVKPLTILLTISQGENLARMANSLVNNGKHFLSGMKIVRDNSSSWRNLHASSTPTKFYLEIYGCSRVPHTLAACRSVEVIWQFVANTLGVACMPSLEQPFFQTALA